MTGPKDILGRRNNMLELTDEDRQRCSCGHMRKWHHDGHCSMCDSVQAECRAFERSIYDR